MNKKSTISYPPIYYRPEQPVIKSNWFIACIETIGSWFIDLFESKKESSSSGAWCGTYRMKTPEKWEAEDKYKNECVRSRETE